jgi:hypothetical protein
MKQYFAQLYYRLARIVTSKAMTTVILVVFALQALLLAVLMQPGVPPDENNHVEFINFYAEHSVSPFFSEQEPTWSLGDKTREVDYLYHYGMSLVARAVPGESLDLYVIRLLSIVGALASFVALIRVFQRLGITRGAINTALAILTNLPMVLMLSAAVNNDVMVWLLTTVATLLFLRIWRQPILLDVVLLANVFAFGGLVKRTLLPLGVFFALATIVVVIRKWKIFKASFTFGPQFVAAAVLLLLGIGLMTERIGGNLYQYGAISPSCNQVQGEEACAGFWLNARTRWIEKGSPAAENIWLPAGTSVDAEPRILPVFMAEWTAASIDNIVNIQTQGWRHEVRPWGILTPLAIAFLSVAFVVAAMYDVRNREKSFRVRARLLIGLIGLFIVLTYMAVNYMNYRSLHIFGLALNGRYILSGIMLLTGLACFYWTLLLGKRLAPAVAIVTVGLFVIGSGLLMMVRNPQLFG